jgi:hypothetical protein
MCCTCLYAAAAELGKGRSEEGLQQAVDQIQQRNVAGRHHLEKKTSTGTAAAAASIVHHCNIDDHMRQRDVAGRHNLYRTEQQQQQAQEAPQRSCYTTELLILYSALLGFPSTSYDTMHGTQHDSQLLLSTEPAAKPTHKA